MRVYLARRASESLWLTRLRFVLVCFRFVLGHSLTLVVQKQYHYRGPRSANREANDASSI